MKETSEIQHLRQYYDRPGSGMIVLYGDKHLNPWRLIRDFWDGLPHSYYRARSVSEREQQYLWAAELKRHDALISPYPTYTDCLSAMCEKSDKKQIIVISDFEYIIKTNPDFISNVATFLHNTWEESPVLVVLSSTSVGFIENTLVEKIGQMAYEISGFVKMKERGFYEMSRYFSENTREWQIEAFSILGGFPELWNTFDPKKTIKENICRTILSGHGVLYEEALRIVEKELRETNVYHSLLTSMAAGMEKLNDLHVHTGFSRAKISVYLKNLMELELVEKVYSCDTEGRENTKKGIYRILNPLVRFYFKFLYPNLSDLTLMDEGEFYDIYIAPYFRHYCSRAFGRVCTEALNRMNDRGRLPVTYTEGREWIGKTGYIDLVGKVSGDECLIAYCNWEKPVYLYEDYEWLMFQAEQAKITPKEIYVFSATRFDETLILEARVKKNLHLLGLKAL